MSNWNELQKAKLWSTGFWFYPLFKGYRQQNNYWITSDIVSQAKGEEYCLFDTLKTPNKRIPGSHNKFQIHPPTLTHTISHWCQEMVLCYTTPEEVNVLIQNQQWKTLYMIDKIHSSLWRDSTEIYTTQALNPRHEYSMCNPQCTCNAYYDWQIMLYFICVCLLLLPFFVGIFFKWFGG